LTVKRFAMTERGKEKSDAASAESNRMLGLAYQGQGDAAKAKETLAAAADFNGLSFNYAYVRTKAKQALAKG
jgi:hypothetical protein